MSPSGHFQAIFTSHDQSIDSKIPLSQHPAICRSLNFCRNIMPSLKHS